MSSADLSTSDGDGTVVVALYGELDVADAPAVADALVAVVAGGPRVVVDLAALDFIDSSGVAALAYARRHARQAGGDLLLAAPRQQVLKVLDIIRLVDDFCVHATVAEAVGSAGGSRRVIVPMWRALRVRWPGAAIRSSSRPLVRLHDPRARQPGLPAPPTLGKAQRCWFGVDG